MAEDISVVLNGVTYTKFGNIWYRKIGTEGLEILRPNDPSPTTLNQSLKVTTEVVPSQAIPLQVIPFVTHRSTPPLTSGPVPDERVYAGLGNDELKKFADEYKEAIDNFNDENIEAINNGTLSPEKQAEFEELQYARQGLVQEIEGRGLLVNKPQCFKKESDNSYTFKDTPECEQFIHSIVGKNLAAISQKKYSEPNPCGTSELAKINTELTNFFTTLKGIKKYGQLYVNGALNKTRNLVNLIRNTSTIIAAVLKSLIQRFRDYILEIIRDAIESVIDYLFNNLAKQLKDTIIQKIVDTIFCKFKDIVKGLKNLVVDFLFELIGKVVNIPFCAAQQFTNALINNLAAQIDSALGPTLDELGNILGGVSDIAGKIFQALDYVIGFESFLCTKPNCPEINEYAAGPWGGPSPTSPNAFESFLTGPDLDVGEATSFLTGAIDNISIFGGTVGGILGGGGLDSDRRSIPETITNCDTDPFRCGPPRVEIFGGGGAGAIGSAVVDTAGKILGVDLIFGGSNYTRPPFVTFIDNCDNGNYASAYTKINSDGEVVDIVMVSNGSGYLNSPNGINEFEEEDGLLSSQEEKVKNYVVCLKEIQVVSTGIGYSVDDTITITPDIPNLKAKVKMTEVGQVIAIELLDQPCSLTTVPEITINSLTGGGLEVRPILEFTRIEDINIDDLSEATQNFVRVVDCVS